MPVTGENWLGSSMMDVPTADGGGVAGFREADRLLSFLPRQLPILIAALQIDFAILPPAMLAPKPRKTVSPALRRTYDIRVLDEGKEYVPVCLVWNVSRISC